MKYVWVVTWNQLNPPKSSIFSSKEAAEKAITALEDAKLNLGMEKKDLYGSWTKDRVFQITRMKVR